MNRIALITLSTILLHACSNNNQNADSDTQEENLNSIVYSEEDSWYNQVFPESKEDGSYSIPDYVYSTDWMESYITYLRKNFRKLDGSNGLWEREGDKESFDCRYWSLAYVNNDTIPEMLLYGGGRLSASVILTQYNGKIFVSPKGGFLFIKGADGIIHSQGAQNDESWGVVYKMCSGQFDEELNYYCFTDYYDVSVVDKYGLNKDYLSNWLMDDGTVGISGIEMNGKVVYISYGIRNWHFELLNQSLDALYYSKGNSILFPKPHWEDERYTIDYLLKIKSRRL